MECQQCSAYVGDLNLICGKIGEKWRKSANRLKNYQYIDLKTYIWLLCLVQCPLIFLSLRADTTNGLNQLCANLNMEINGFIKEAKEKLKKQIFEQAKEASDKLVFWNHPNQKRHLSPLDQIEAEHKLWKENKLDALIYRKLGSDGWNNYKSKKLNDQDTDQLIEETRQLNLFLNSLPKFKQ